MTLVFRAQVKAVPLGRIRLRSPSSPGRDARRGGRLQLPSEEAAAPGRRARRADAVGGAGRRRSPPGVPVREAARGLPCLRQACPAGPAAGADRRSRLRRVSVERSSRRRGRLRRVDVGTCGAAGAGASGRLTPARPARLRATSAWRRAPGGVRWPVRRTPIGSARSSAVGTIAGMRAADGSRCRSEARRGRRASCRAACGSGSQPPGGRRARFELCRRLLAAVQRSAGSRLPRRRPATGREARPRTGPCSTRSRFGAA